MGVGAQTSHTAAPMDPMKVVSACYFSATARNPLNSLNKPCKDKPQATVRYKSHRSLQIKVNRDTEETQPGASLSTEAGFALVDPLRTPEPYH